jgi:hypothetical protein
MELERPPAEARPFATGQVTRFFLPLAIQALSQSITYPLVASVASRGPGGPLNLAGLVQATAVMSLLGTLGMGLITTGMVHGRSREGFARFVSANNWICASVVLLQMLLWMPPLAHFVFAGVIGLSPAIEEPARQALLCTVFLQIGFFLRNPYQVALYNARATGLATGATLGRIVLTAILSPLFCAVGWVGPIWAVVALTVPVAVETLVSRILARPYMKCLPAHEGPLPTTADLVRFNLPLSLGGLFMTLSGFMTGAFIARAAEPERMLPIYYVAVGIVNPVAFAAMRLQAVVLAFPPSGPSDRSTLRFAVRAGVLLGLIPLVFLLPAVKDAYFIGFQNMPRVDLPLISLTVLALTLHPLCSALRAQAEGLAAVRREPAMILTGQAVYMGVLVSVAFVCLSLHAPGNLIAPCGVIVGNLAASGTLRLVMQSRLSDGPGAGRELPVTRDEV